MRLLRTVHSYEEKAMRVPTFDELVMAFGMYGVCMALRSPEWAAAVAGAVYGCDGKRPCHRVDEALDA